MDYVVIAKEPTKFQRPSSWQVSRWVDGKGKFLGRDLTHEDAKALAEREAGDLPVRNWMDCVVCGKAYPEPFMVLNPIWSDAKLGRGSTHLVCLETLLGRKLVPEDFNLDLPINAPLAFGLQMGAQPAPNHQEGRPSRSGHGVQA
jgi:hypothetical protein